MLGIKDYTGKTLKKGRWENIKIMSYDNKLAYIRLNIIRSMLSYTVTNNSNISKYDVHFEEIIIKKGFSNAKRSSHKQTQTSLAK